MASRFLTLLALPSLAAAGTLRWTLGDEISCSGAFDVEDFEWACTDEDGDGVCALGDSLDLVGNLTAYKYMPGDASIKVNACVMWVFCYSWNYQDVDFCDSFGLTPTDGISTCPSTGEYTFEKTLQAPGSSSLSNLPSWLQGRDIQFVVDFVQNDSYSDAYTTAKTTTCSLTVSTSSVQDEAEEEVEYTMMFAALVGFGVAGFWMRRRRNIKASNALQNLLEHEMSAGSTEMVAPKQRMLV